MSKLYVFGIGGTGSRVLRALTMLLASGVACKADTIVPIIIDPDASAADLTRTVAAMNKYIGIHKKLEFGSKDTNRFFRTAIEPVTGMDNFKLPLQNTQDKMFKDFMRVSELNAESRALINMLFSQKNLNSDMVVGFKGNPNIGSVVLNQFALSQQYKDFANGFEQGDRIFIISSIFGGTGASGFPLLLKTLRNDKKSQKWNYISNAKIGAISVLPYFNVLQDDNSGVDSSTFLSKAKSALAYYERNISDNNSVDALYYVGDEAKAEYDNHDGGSEQRNKAHVVELISALAILNFAATPDESLEKGTLHYEYGLDSDAPAGGPIIFRNLGTRTKELIQKPMTQFMLMGKYLENVCEHEYRHQPWAIDNKLDRNFFTGQFYADVCSVHQYYVEWLREMGNNKRAFKPFDEDRVFPLFDIINEGAAPRKSYCLSSNYALVDNVLNGRWKNWNRTAPVEQKFIELFYRATEKLVKDKFNM